MVVRVLNVPLAGGLKTMVLAALVRLVTFELPVICQTVPLVRLTVDVEAESVCIVPVHAQHRGRLFLPFADDDPRTAEVLSKVILLARDDEIQDPSILEQLR